MTPADLAKLLLLLAELADLPTDRRLLQLDVHNDAACMIVFDCARVDGTAAVRRT
jgi:hypothetical protein